jgi:orotidine-5'-phosphate decarboxylase
MTSAERARQIICAIDTADLDEAKALAEALRGRVGAVKLGLEFFAAHGPEGVRSVAEHGLPIFLDLKLCDIPNTVAGALRAAAACGPSMVTVHACGGPAMMRAAAAAGLRIADATGTRPLLLAVTVLTSLDDDDIAAVGVSGPLDGQVRRLAALAQACGLDGVVASAHEIEMLRRHCGPELAIVAPGIRPGWASADDQKRIVTPAEALRAGADYLVVGRPITRAEDPAAAAARIADEMAAAA